MKISIITFCIVTIALTGDCFGLSCHFASGSYTLPFGTLDPASSANVTATVTITLTCTGTNATWTLTSDNGKNYNGTSNRMRNQNNMTQYIPYSVTFSPTNGNRWTTTIRGSGTILNGNYINAYIGPYTDQITLTVAP